MSVRFRISIILCPALSFITEMNLKHISKNLRTISKYNFIFLFHRFCYLHMEKMSTPCAACKYLRRKCTKDCLFAPYFPVNKQDKYAAVHKVFGASHVATLINDIHPNQRQDAMNSLAFEAQARILDPVYGCTRYICLLQRQLKYLQDQIQIAKNELASYTIVPTLEPPPPMTYQQNHRNQMMMPITASYGGHLTAQQLHEEAHRFASTQTAQVQQTPETQMQDNQRAIIVHDKKISSKM